MKYRDVDYTIVQGLGRHVWKWSATIGAVRIGGQTATKGAAIEDAERAIERALSPRKWDAN